jgi:hypothetical protein
VLNKCDLVPTGVAVSKLLLTYLLFLPLLLSIVKSRLLLHLRALHNGRPSVTTLVD